MSKPTRVFLARHGATLMTEQHRYAGISDVDLSDLGRQQAEQLRERLSREKLSAGYASPLKRARETAAIALQGHDLAGIQTVPEFRELNYGHWEGMKHSEARERFNVEYSEWAKSPSALAPSGGETGNEVIARAVPALREITQKHFGEQIFIVSHSATIRLIFCSLLGIDPNRYRDLDQHPTALNGFDFYESGKVRLIFFNQL